MNVNSANLPRFFTYAEAKKHIGEKIAGWKLTEEDFEEAQKSI